MGPDLYQSSSGSGGGAPSGPAGGDLGGSYPNPTVVSVADVTTGILAPTNGGTANIATANKGYFFGVQVNPSLSNGGNITPAAIAQQVQAFMFVLPFQVTVNHITINVTGALGGAGTITVGIYSADGTTKLIDSGTFNGNSATVQTNTLGAPVTLTPGPYYFAQSASFIATGTVAGSNSFGAQLNMLNNQSVKKCGNAANSATSGVLPASLGAITAATLNYMLALFEP